MLSLSETQLIERQLKRLDLYRSKNAVRKLFYHGENRVKNLNTAIPPVMRNVRHAVGWAGIAVDTVNTRIKFQGWSDEEEELGLNLIYDDNHLESESAKFHLDFLRYGVSYLFLSQGDDDDPDVLVHPASPNNAIAEFSLRKRRAINAIRVVNDDSDRVIGDLLTETEIIPFGVHKGLIYEDGPRVVHNLGRVPVVMAINNGESDSTKGHSDITVPMMRTIDHVLRYFLSMDVAREFYSYPQRYLLGAPDVLRKGADGRETSPYQALMSGLWNIPKPKGEGADMPQVGEFSTNDPSNFIKPIETLAAEFATEAWVPESYFGVSPTANPTSADAVRANENRLIMRASARVSSLTRPWEEAARLALMLRDGSTPEDFRHATTMWGEVATVAPGAAADRVMKLVQSGVIQPDSRIALKELGFSRKEQDIIRSENNVAASRNIIANLAAENARRQQEERDALEATEGADDTEAA